MNEIAIDTLTIAHRLRDAGFDDKQAEAVTFAIRDGITGSLASKEDIARLEGMIESQGARFNGKFILLYWMLGVLVAGVASLVIKTFLG